MKVLLVEDDPSVQDLFREVLGYHDVQLAIAKNRIETIQKISEQSPDIVVIDLFIPGDNGQAIMMTIRSQLGCPIVATSSYYTSDTQAGDIGFDHFLAKPIDPSKLVPYLIGVVNAHVKSQ
jgi:CheY-like chemotaxis protein